MRLIALTMDGDSRKSRKNESADTRAKRLKNSEQQRRVEDAADDERMDKMVRENIKRHGG